MKEFGKQTSKQANQANLQQNTTLSTNKVTHFEYKDGKQAGKQAP
jgi:hypothetical protein